MKLRTEHLTLRPLPPEAAALLPRDRASAAAILAASLDPEWPLPDILDLMPAHALRGSAEAPYGIWVMIETRTNAVVGDIGFLGPPDEMGELETGYSVIPSRRRRGYATEALNALVGWALDHPTVTAVVAGTDPDNDVSQRVLGRAGFAQTREDSGGIRWRHEPRAPRG